MTAVTPIVRHAMGTGIAKAVRILALTRHGAMTVHRLKSIARRTWFPGEHSVPVILTTTQHPRSAAPRLKEPPNSTKVLGTRYAATID